MDTVAASLWNTLLIDITNALNIVSLKKISKHIYVNLYHSTSVSLFFFYFISILVILRSIDFFSAFHGICIM